MNGPALSASADPRLILRAEELDAVLELLFVSEAALWAEAEPALAAAPLGRAHYRAAFLLKRRPGMGVGELARLTGVTKQGASKVLSELEAAGLAEKTQGEEDARRRPARLTPRGADYEAKISERLRDHLARAYRAGGLDAAAGARRILAALAGPRAPRRERRAGA